ncbi:MAG: hypothetical protein WCS85_04445 [Candidatus Peribacteraceae bacterium]|jgi:hypothetical protein
MRLTIIVAVALASTMLVSTALATSSSSSSKPPIDSACVITALDKRDDAIIAAFDLYAASERTALVARMNALKSDWGITDATQRKAAIKDAWKTYRDSIKSANSTFRIARKEAWKQFKADAKVCKVSLPVEESNGQSADSLL